MKTGYEIYCEWCAERGQKPPTKEWWDKASAMNIPYTAPYEWNEKVRADQREIDRERREGWAYD